MPFERLTPDAWKRQFSRAIVFGPPGSWKTSSLVTWPRPIHVMVYPGEKGSASLPQPSDPQATEFHSYTWTSDPAALLSPRKIVKEVHAATIAILAGKEGPIVTFAGDGLHKLYSLMFAANVDELISTYPDKDEDKLRGRAYGLTHEEFSAYLSLVCTSKVDRVVFTMWDGSTKDNQKDKSPDASSHIWPDLPGEMAKKIVGEAGVVVYAVPGQEIAPGKFTPGKWLTRKQGAVWGAGIKAPLAVAQRIPTAVEQHWMALEKLAFGPFVPLTSKPAPAAVVKEPAA